MPSSRFINSVKAAIGSDSIALHHKATQGKGREAHAGNESADAQPTRLLKA